MKLFKNLYNLVVVRLIFFILVSLSFVSCGTSEQIDLAELKLNESVRNLLSDTSLKSLGTDSVEYPFAILAEDTDSSRFVFSSIPVQKVYFLLPAKINNDEVSKNGGGHFESTIFSTKKQLENNLKVLKEKSIPEIIFGFRAEILGQKNHDLVKQMLIKRYGQGTKNPNTDKGLYWNVKKEGRYIFFAPEYDRLIVLNSKNLSKTCYWDIQNGTLKMDIRPCDSDRYFRSLGVEPIN